MDVGNVLHTDLGDLVVDQATGDRARSVLELRDDLARWMLECNIRQWRPGELPLEWIETCVSEGWLYVVPRGEQVIASVAIVWDDPLMWGEMPEAAGYVHMLMVDRNFAGHGIGRSLLAWSERFIADSGRHLARLDCVRNNRQLRDYYERAGYVLVAYNDLREVEWAFEAALYEKPLGR
jgi:GNAT superfamily N-acetyltransferase